MRIGLIGDIHANLLALEAVLAHARARGVTHYWNIGDFVGYNAFPEQVVQFLQREPVTSIVGNYDCKVLKAEQKREKWQRSKDPDKVTSFLWTYQALSPASRAYLAGLPEQIRLEEQGYSVLLVHGSPASMDEHLLPDTPQSRLEELAAQARADIIVCGHSHRAFVRRAGGACFINTGSVGRADDGDPRACYAILQIEPGQYEVEHFRLAYDVARAAAEIRARGLPDEFARMVLEGRSLNDVKENGKSGDR